MFTSLENKILFRFLAVLRLQLAASVGRLLVSMNVERSSSTPPRQPLSEPKKHPIKVILKFTAIYCPIAVIVSCGLIGIILAPVEGWTWSQAFLYVTSNICGLCNPLTQVSPTTTVGNWVDALSSFWSMAVTGVTIGVAGDLAGTSSRRSAAMLQLFVHTYRHTNL